jgi:hypothetical protein
MTSRLSVKNRLAVLAMMGLFHGVDWSEPKPRRQVRGESIPCLSAERIAKQALPCTIPYPGAMKAQQTEAG